jgi:hypothetical protein
LTFYNFWFDIITYVRRSCLFVVEINVQPLEEVFAKFVSDDEEPGLELRGRPPLKLAVEAPQGRQKAPERHVGAPGPEAL